MPSKSTSAQLLPKASASQSYTSPDQNKLPLGSSSKGPGYVFDYTTSAPKGHVNSQLHCQTVCPGRRRFFEALLLSILFVLVLSSTTGAASGFVNRVMNHGHWNDDSWQVPPQYHQSRCVNGDDWEPLNEARKPDYPFLARTSFDLPLSSELLFLISRGSEQNGHLQVSTTRSDSEDVKVDVLMHYRVESALRFAGACLLTGKPGENGVGLFTPRYWHRDGGKNHVFFEVTVHLPIGHENPLVIDAFKTDLVNFSADLDRLKNLVEFRQLELKTVNGHVNVESLYADDARIVTVNGPITGSFNTSTSLRLETANGPVKAAVGLTNDDSLPTTLDIRTANGKVDSVIAMYSSKKSKTGGKFRTSVSTANTPINIKLATSPLDSTVRLTAATANAPVLVSLPPTYEGGLSMSTSPYMQTSLEENTVEDPSGRERRRIVKTIKKGWGSLHGFVNWEPSGKGASDSFVSLSSVNAGLTISL